MPVFISTLLFIIFLLMSVTEAFCFPCDFPGTFRIINSLAIVSGILAIYFVIRREQDEYLVEFKKLLNEDEDVMIEVELA